MKKIFYLLLLVSTTAFCQEADMLIKNGKIIDGTGNSWTIGDVAIKNGKIVAKGHLDSWTATKNIDATGLIVCPGFIDIHTHIESGKERSYSKEFYF
jgi:N-acyl-D-amino-acid deacylase